MYSAVEEAFDNPLRQQMQRMDKENNINNYKESLMQSVEDYQRQMGLIPPHSAQTGDDVIQGYINERQYPRADLPFFTAQGGFNIQSQNPSQNPNQNPEFTNISNMKINKGDVYNDHGTTISELRRQENDKYDDSFFEDTLSILDSNYSDLFSNSSKSEEEIQQQSKLSHNYCINKFLKSIVDDGNDMLSLASSQDDQLYDHIKSCKYCRSQINNKMKSMYSNNSSNKSEEDNAKITKVSNNIEFPEKIFGYKVKEIIIIIAISIMIIFILDLLVRIGRKTINKRND